MAITRKIIKYAVEPTNAAYEAPTIAIPHRDGTLNVQTLAGENIERQVERLDGDTVRSLRAGDYATIRFEVGLSQSQSLGAAPPWGGLLLGCSCAEAALNEVNGTIAAYANSAGIETITLQNTASSVDDAYLGRFIVTNLVQFVCIGYNGTTKEATVLRVDGSTGTPTTAHTYSLKAATRYTRVTSYAGDSSCSFDYYEYDESGDLTLWKIKGARGEATIAMNERAEPMLRIDMVGIVHEGPTAVLANAAPAMDYSDWGTPPIPNSSNTFLKFHSYSAITRKFEFMTGSKATFGQRVNQEIIRYPRILTPTATLDMDMALSSAFNADDKIASRAVASIYLTHGTGNKNRITFRSESMQIVGKGDSSQQDGVYSGMLNLSFRADSVWAPWVLTC